VRTRRPTRSLASALVAAAALAAACGSSDKCERASACAPGEFCFEGRCAADLPDAALTLPAAPSRISAGLISKSYAATCSTASPPAPPGAAQSLVDAGWVQDFASVAVGAPVTFAVPPGTASVTVTLQAINATQTVNLSMELADNYVVPVKVVLPNGGVLFQVAEAFTTPLDPSFGSGYFVPNPWTASFAVPEDSRMADLALSAGELPAGTWTLTVGDLQSNCSLFGGCASAPAGTYRATVIAKPGRYARSGRLDLSLYFASTTVSASASATAPAFQRYVESIARLLAQAGIALGDVRFFQLPRSPTDVAAVFSTTFIDSSPFNPPCSQLARLFALGEPNVDGVHVFLVDDLRGGGGNVVGLTGGVPAPSGIPGAATGGIVISLADVVTTGCDLANPAISLNCGADFSAYVTAHEMGHWLGLFHPTEATGELYDPLDDTPSCSCTQCGYKMCPAGYPPGLAASMCAADAGPCGGGRNLMFWVVQPGWSVGTLTREQGLVMRSNPGVKWGTP
jgi:hypothetical protein